MSRKRKNAWRCKGCGMQMHRGLAEQANQVKDGMGMQHKTVMHICGQCKTLHIQDGDGLRLATPAEQFAYRMQMGKLADQIDAAKVPATDVPTGSLIIAEGER
jgi:hypothetical protein